MWSADQLRSGLLTDLYHVDSAYVSWRANRNGLTTFDLYTRSHPFGGGYLLVAGLELAATFAQEFRYTDEEIAYLQRVRTYEDAFYEELRRTRFTGEILGMPEGEIAFPQEPLVRVTAPFREALLLEAGLLHTISLSTLLATKAARVVCAAQGAPVAEFAFRRAQEPFVVARSAYIAGCASTSFLAAAHAFGIPTSGTIPHALVQAFPAEEEAFRAVAASLARYTLLIDTYDVRQAILTAVEVARDAKRRLGHEMVAVRLDSGDILADSRHCRSVLDDAGLDGVRILASGDMDEYRIAELVAANAPIDAYGVGTSIGVGAGSVERGVAGGALGAVYKLVWYDADQNRAADEDETPIKVAGPKSTWPGKKQVSRIGDFEGDVIHLEDEAPLPNARTLLQPILRDGVVLPEALPPLDEIRERALGNLAALPEAIKRIDQPDSYAVRFSERLQAMRDRAIAVHRDRS
ncbi:MAG: nicotinate phosphoribosyltransferase [Thermomicrobiales bacterium]